MYIYIHMYVCTYIYHLIVNANLRHAIGPVTNSQTSVLCESCLPYQTSVFCESCLPSDFTRSLDYFMRLLKYKPIAGLSEDIQNIGVPLSYIGVPLSYMYLSFLYVF